MMKIYHFDHHLLCKSLTTKPREHEIQSGGYESTPTQSVNTHPYNKSPGTTYNRAPISAQIMKTHRFEPSPEGGGVNNPLGSYNSIKGEGLNHPPYKVG